MVQWIETKVVHKKFLTLLDIGKRFENIFWNIGAYTYPVFELLIQFTDHEKFGICSILRVTIISKSISRRDV